MNQTSRIPVRPWICPDVEVIASSEGRILLRSLRGSVLLKGEFAASSLLREVLVQLDGTRTLNDLVAFYGHAYRPELENLISLLAERDMLAKQATPQDPDCGSSRFTSHEQSYWDRFSSGAQDAQGRLDAAHVLIAGLGAIGSTVARSLYNAGVTRLTLVDPANVRAADRLFGYPPVAQALSRVDALKASLVGRTMDVHARCCAVDELSELEELISHATLVIVCSDDMSLAGYDRINATTLRTGTPWVSARVDRCRGIVGPFVVPNETACFACFELRSRLNAQFPEDHVATYAYWRGKISTDEHWPILAPALAVVGNYLASDVLRVVAGGLVSAALGRVVQFDLHSFESRSHELLKLPRCPACSRAMTRPLSRIWDVPSLTRGGAAAPPPISDGSNNLGGSDAASASPSIAG